MNDCSEDQTDDDALLRDGVSDDAIEAAAVARGGFPTLLYGTYCFGCPSGPTIRSAPTAGGEDRSSRRLAAVALTAVVFAIIIWIEVH